MSALPITIYYHPSGWTLQALSQSFAFQPGPNKKNCGQLVDCCSLNLSCQDVEQGIYFSLEDIRNLALAYKQKITGSKVIVLDIASAQGYLSKTIYKKEEQVMAFLNHPATKESHRRFKASSMQAVIDVFETEGSFATVVLEGSLKRDLLLHGGFSKDEITQLQEDKLLFCQIAEVFINAMKFGYEANSPSHHLFSAETYFKQTNGDPFVPCQTSYTIYPPLYEKIYHVKGHIPQELAKVFSVTGKENTLCITEAKC